MILRTVQDEADAERFAAFHSKYESEAWGITSDMLLRHHPAITYSDFLLVEDEETGEIVSTTCLIPWRICYEGISLDAATLAGSIKSSLTRTTAGLPTCSTVNPSCTRQGVQDPQSP